MHFFFVPKAHLLGELLCTLFVFFIKTSRSCGIRIHKRIRNVAYLVYMTPWAALYNSIFCWSVKSYFKLVMNRKNVPSINCQ